MSGVDTYRGINFQGAVALGKAVDLIENGEPGSSIRVEGIQDIADIELMTADGQSDDVIQVKSRLEPGRWSLLEVVRIFAAWDGQGSKFEFITNADLGPTAAELRRSLDDIRTTSPSAASDLLVDKVSEEIALRYVESRPSSYQDVRDLLKRCQITTREADVENQFVRASYRLLSVIQAVIPGSSTETSDLAALKLWTLLQLSAGSEVIERRTWTREELAASIGIDPAVLSSAFSWSPSTRSLYRERVTAQLSPMVRPRFLPAGGRNQSRAGEISLLLAELPRQDLVICGHTGSGKTTSCAALVQHACNDGRFALLLDDQSYFEGQLFESVADIAAFWAGARPTTAQVADLLRDPETLLVLDGVSELSKDARLRLRDEIRALSRGPSRCIVVIAGRSVPLLEGVIGDSAVTYQLVPWGEAELLEFIRSRGVEDASMVRTLANRVRNTLQSASGTPQLAALAADQYLSGGSATSRVELYAELIQQFEERTPDGGTEFLRVALAGAFAEMLLLGSREGSQLAWTRNIQVVMRRSLDHGVELADSNSEVFQYAIDSGLLARLYPFSPYSAPHDSIADYLAATAVVDSVAGPLDPTLESNAEGILFLSELGGLDDEMRRRIATADPLLAVRAGSRDKVGLGPSANDVVLDLVRKLADGTDVSTRIPDQIEVETGRINKFVWTSGSQEFSKGFSPSIGPLGVAISIWALMIRSTIGSFAGPWQGIAPSSLEEAATELLRHQETFCECRGQMVKKVVPPGLQARVEAALGACGMVASLSYRDTGLDAPMQTQYIAVDYDREANVFSAVLDYQGAAKSADKRRHDDVDKFLSRTPARAAWEGLSTTLEELTERGWLI